MAHNRKIAAKDRDKVVNFCREKLQQILHLIGLELEVGSYFGKLDKHGAIILEIKKSQNNSDIGLVIGRYGITLFAIKKILSAATIKEFGHDYYIEIRADRFRSRDPVNCVSVAQFIGWEVLEEPNINSRITSIFNEAKQELKNYEHLHSD
ncbi:MAG: hypothetical protein PHN19_03315 [Patescibacteria group bacterium]|nr:hypothetical protein [Patescibacteria group bacterium]